MANEISVAQLAGSIPDVVRAIALQARFDSAVMVKNVMNVDADVQKAGDRVSLSIMPTLSVNSVGTGGSVTRQQVSLTAVEVVVDTWKECTVDITDQASAQSALNMVKEFSKEMGDALGEVQDTSLGALYATLTGLTAVGPTDTPVPFDDSAIRLARLRLDKAKVPKTDRMWFICPDAEQDLLAQARFTEAQNTGFARGLQVEKGRISSLYGDPVYVTNQIASVAGTVSGTVRKNMLVHKQALGIATQRNFKIVPLAKVQLSQAITGHILYGVKVVRSNHGVVVNSAVNADA